MVVHAHESWNHAVTVEIQYLRTLRRLPTCRNDALDLAARDHQCLIIFRRRSGSIDHPNMIEHDDGMVVFHICFGIGRRRLRKCSGGNNYESNESHLQYPLSTSSAPE